MITYFIHFVYIHFIQGIRRPRSMFDPLVWHACSPYPCSSDFHIPRKRWCCRSEGNMDQTQLQMRNRHPTQGIWNPPGMQMWLKATSYQLAVNTPLCTVCVLCISLHVVIDSAAVVWKDPTQNMALSLTLAQCIKSSRPWESQVPWVASVSELPSQ